MCLADARLFLPGLNLTYTDRASMAASTEVRVPFVDPIVFQAAFSLAANQKIRGRNQKVGTERSCAGLVAGGDCSPPESFLLGALAGLDIPRPAGTGR